jgi:hypothetical protein
MSVFFRKGVVICPEDMNGFDWPEKMKQLGLNTLGLHSGGGKTANIPERLQFTIDDSFKNRVKRLSLDFEYELHAGSYMMPRELFEKHPEYFIFNHREKQRLPEHNWCVSSEDTWKIVCENIKDTAKKLTPSTHRYFFWGDDGSGWCHCEKCSNFSDSDQELLAANKFAAALQEIDKKAEVAFLAYLKTLEVPENITPAKNVFLEFAPFHRCYNHPINDKSCSINRKHWEKLQSLMKIFPPEKIHILEYWLDSSLSSGHKKPAKKTYFDKNLVSADLKAYCNLGIRSITTFAVYMDGEYFKSFGEQELIDYSELLSAFK